MSALELEQESTGDGPFMRFTAVEDIGRYSLVTSARDGNPAHIQDANASVAGKRPCWGLTLDRIGPLKNGNVLLFGYVRNVAWSWTPGAILYMGSTDGAITESAPPYEQEVGWALTSDAIIFLPKSVEIAI